MTNQYQNARLSSLVISQSLKFRKNCLQQSVFNKQYKQGQPYQTENYLDKQTKSLNSSLQSRKQARFKAGSIGKIKRNHLNNVFSEQQQQKTSNLNLQREQSIGTYKKLYDQNKILNDALKSKIYPGNQKNNISNLIINRSNYNFSYQQKPGKCTGNQLYKISEQNDQFLNKKSDILGSKYQSLISEYDQKRSFIKEQIQAMKQKSTLQSFQKYDVNLKKSQFYPAVKQKIQSNYKQNRGGIALSPYSKNKQNEKVLSSCNNIRKLANFQSQKHQKHVSFKQNNYTHDFKCQSNQKYNLAKSSTKLFQKLESRPLSSSNGFNINSSIQNSKQQNIDKKFKAYQQKLQKYKSLQKGNSSFETNAKITKTPQNKCKLQQNIKPETKSRFVHLGKSQKTQNIYKADKIVKKPQTQSMNIFIQLISKQIQKDEELRLIKSALKNQSMDQIQKILKQKFSLSIELQKFQLSHQEYDPFFESKQKQNSLQSLVKIFLNAYDFSQNYWNNLIKNRLCRDEAQQIYDNLNSEKKNELNLGSFARQISFQMNKTVRSRQMYSIHKRLFPLTKNNFVQKLSKQ